MLERFKRTTRMVWPEDVSRVDTLKRRITEDSIRREKAAGKPLPISRREKVTESLLSSLVALEMPVQDDASTVSIEFTLTREQESVLDQSRLITPEDKVRLREEFQQRMRDSDS